MEAKVGRGSDPAFEGDIVDAEVRALEQAASLEHALRRIEPGEILGVELGDAIVQRIVGGRVTPAVLRDVAYISYLLETKAPEGPWFELALIHHTDCGSAFLADPELRAGFAARGYDEAELEVIPVIDPAATVRADAAKLVSAPQVSPKIQVSGHVYDVKTGLLQTVVPAES